MKKFAGVKTFFSVAECAGFSLEAQWPVRVDVPHNRHAQENAIELYLRIPLSPTDRSRL